jgi:hypothetical protein
MSYNILADLYADSDFSRQNLFPQCPPFALGNVSLYTKANIFLSDSVLYFYLTSGSKTSLRESGPGPRFLMYKNGKIL